MRHYFDLPTDSVYLNCASRGPLLKSSLKVGIKCLNDKIHPWKIKSNEIEEVTKIFEFGFFFFLSF